jgi:hypothetical protein
MRVTQRRPDQRANSLSAPHLSRLLLSALATYIVPVVVLSEGFATPCEQSEYQPGKPFLFLAESFPQNASLVLSPSPMISMVLFSLVSRSMYDNSVVQNSLLFMMWS